MKPVVMTANTYEVSTMSIHSRTTRNYSYIGCSFEQFAVNFCGSVLKHVVLSKLLN